MYATQKCFSSIVSEVLAHCQAFQETGEMTDDVSSILAQLAKKLNYFKKICFNHKDIRPANDLFVEEMRHDVPGVSNSVWLQICDEGLSQLPESSIE